MNLMQFKPCFHGFISWIKTAKNSKNQGFSAYKTLKTWLALGLHCFNDKFSQCQHKSAVFGSFSAILRKIDQDIEEMLPQILKLPAPLSHFSKISWKISLILLNIVANIANFVKFYGKYP